MSLALAVNNNRIRRRRFLAGCDKILVELSQPHFVMSKPILRPRREGLLVFRQCSSVILLIVELDSFLNEAIGRFARFLAKTQQGVESLMKLSWNAGTLLRHCEQVHRSRGFAGIEQKSCLEQHQTGIAW